MEEHACHEHPHEGHTGAHCPSAHPLAAHTYHHLAGHACSMEPEEHLPCLHTKEVVLGISLSCQYADSALRRRVPIVPQVNAVLASMSTSLCLCVMRLRWGSDACMLSIASVLATWPSFCSLQALLVKFPGENCCLSPHGEHICLLQTNMDRDAIQGAKLLVSRFAKQI